MTLPNWILPVKKLVLTPQAKEWCKIPYPNHPKGCPNYYGKCFQGGKKGIRMIDTFIDPSKPIYIVYVEFDLETHVEKMRIKHPKWTERQLRNVLYWQGAQRAKLRRKVAEAIEITGIESPISCMPELYGVNVYATCLKSGLKLEPIKGLKLCRHIYFIGHYRTHRFMILNPEAKCRIYIEDELA